MDLCIDLDLPSREKNIKLVKLFKDIDGLWYKVNLRNFIRDGKKIIRDIKCINETSNIFLDLKLNDTPSDMVSSAMEIAKLDVGMVTVHISSGEIALRSIVNVLRDYYDKRPLIIGITVLTSMNYQDCLKVFGSNNIERTIGFMSMSAYNCHLDGVVCKANNVQSIRSKSIPADFKFICPVVPYGCNDDHSKTINLSIAKRANASMVVMPVHKTDDPRKDVDLILDLIR